MTCREKLAIEHPDYIGPKYRAGARGCPREYGYLPDNPCETVPKFTCKECWDLDSPEPIISSTEPNEVVDLARATIKDSGSTTEFDTGAHRDARGGKGRCDLLPLEVVANFICDDNDDTDWVLRSLREFQKDGCTCHLYSALEHFNVRCWDNCYTMMLEVAKHYEAGAAKYGADNWKRGMPAYIYIDSAIRHYLKWLRGDEDERHDLAFCWNIMCCIWEVNYHKEESK